MKVHTLDLYNDLKAVVECPRCVSYTVTGYTMADTIFVCTCGSCGHRYIVLDKDGTYGIAGSFWL